MTLLDKTEKEVTEKEPLDLMSLIITEARSSILTWWLLWSVERHTPDETLEGRDSSGGES